MSLRQALPFRLLFPDSEGPVLDLEAHFVISSGLDKELPSMGSRFEELDVEGGRSGAAGGQLMLG